MRPFELLNSLMSYADSDLVFCRKEGRLVYRTSKAEGVRESFSRVKDVLAFSLREGECRKVREILGDPRRLAALLWFSLVLWWRS